MKSVAGVEVEKKERIRRAIHKKLKEMGEPHPVGCFLNSMYIDEWLEEPEYVYEEEYDGDLYSEDIEAGRLYGDSESGVSDLEEDHFWGIESEWVYDKNGMRLYRV